MLNLAGARMDGSEVPLLVCSKAGRNALLYELESGLQEVKLSLILLLMSCDK